MGKEIKTLDGVMNLDDSNDVLPLNNHREARNGVFKGNAPEMHFTAIRGNVKVNNASIVTNDCRFSGNALFIPDCSLVGTAVYIPKCQLVGTAVWTPEAITMATTVSCTAYIGSGRIVVSNFAGGWKSFSFIAISTVSAADALSKLDNAGTRNDITESSYTYNNLGNAIYYIAIMDIGGLKGSTSATVACLPQPVSCVLNHTCDPYTGQSNVRANTFTGGGGTYQISTILHTSEANALAGAFVDITLPNTNYNNVVDGTYYIGLRDKANTANKVAISITTDCILTGDCTCWTVTNATGNRLSVDFFACNGSPSSRVVEANSPEYICVAGGTTPVVPEGLTASECDAEVPCTSNLLCYKCGDATPEWVDQNYNVCIDCISYDVYKDINPNSESYNKYKVNNVIGTTTAPTASVCNLTASYSENVGIYYFCIGGQINEYVIYKNTNTCFTGNQWSRGPNGTITYATNPVNDYPDDDRILVDQQFNYCYNCVTYPVFRDKNSCSPTWNEYFINNTISLGQTTPPAGDCNTTATWTSQAYNTCSSCTNYLVYRDTNPCSPTYNNYRVNNVNVGNTAPANGNCVTTPTLTPQNYNTCYQCGNWAVFKDTNPCSATYNRFILNQPPGTTFINVGTTAPSNVACNTAAIWQNDGAVFCSSCVAYQPQRNTNPCFTGTQTRNVNIGAAAPCNYTANYSIPDGTYWTCIPPGTTQQNTIYRNSNPCFTGNQWSLLGTTYSSKPPTNTEPSVAQVWVQNGNNYCLGRDLYQPQIQSNPCAVNYNGVRDQLIQADSSTCAESYTMSNCLGGGATTYSAVYPIGSFSIGQRVTSSGVTYVITGTTTPFAGIVITSTGLTGCPEYTQFTDLCTGSTYYILGTGYPQVGTSSDIPDACLQPTGTTSSPTGTQIYNFIDNPSCECV